MKNEQCTSTLYELENNRNNLYERQIIRWQAIWISMANNINSTMIGMSNSSLVLFVFYIIFKYVV